jgi:type 1 glutamine amidotransferase
MPPWRGWQHRTGQPAPVYSYLPTAPAVTVHATHTHEDREHPVMWSLDRRPGRTFYDALGHDAASYDSPEHRELLLRAIAWLAAS